MAATTSTPNTLLGTFHHKSGGASLASNFAVVVLGTLFIALSAKINVPVWPVPVTLQSFAIAALSAAFGLRIGLATVSLYLLQGAFGMPVFATGGGLAYLVGPTGGFLIGFLLMAVIVGYAADRGASGKLLPMFAAMIVGNAALLVVGFAWLVMLSGAAGWIDQANVIGSAFAKAIQPFILWDTLKMALAALTVTGAWKAIGPRRG